MAKIRRIQNGFAAGEWSPSSFGRTDLEKYYRAAETIENFIILNNGAVTRRPGYRFVVNTKFQDGRRTRVYYMPSTAGDGYVIEIGDDYLRFIYDGVQVEDPDNPGSPYELVTPYDHSHVFSLHFAQIGDIQYIANGNYDPAKLINNNGIFTLTTIAFKPPPTAPITLYPEADLTPGAVTGIAITFTASDPVFATANQFQEIRHAAGPGRATITVITDSTHVLADITEDFPSTDTILEGDWYLDGPFNVALTPTEIGAGTDPTQPVGKIIVLTASDPVFTADMVGLYIKMNLGMLKITKFTSSTVVEAQILGVLSGDDAAPAGTWTLEADAWAGDPPDTVCFFEGRLWFGRGFTFWGSVVDDYENFALGATDSDAVEFTIATGDNIADIKWMTGAEELLFGTAQNEIKAHGGTNQPITPTNVNVKPMDSYGSSDLQAIKFGSAVIFVERGKSKIREMEFELTSNSFVSKNLILLADHITLGGIAQWARQKRPHEVIWFVNGRGELCGFHRDKVEEIMAWDRQTIADYPVE